MNKRQGLTPAQLQRLRDEGRNGDLFEPDLTREKRARLRRGDHKAASYERQKPTVDKAAGGVPDAYQDGIKHLTRRLRW